MAMDGLGLNALRVLDLSDTAGDVLTALQLTGARVLQVTSPAPGRPADSYGDITWPDGPVSAALHLDLTCGPDRDTLLAFVREAHLLIESWRSGFAARLGFGYDAMRTVNPALVYLSLPQRLPLVEPSTLMALEAALASARRNGTGSHLVASPPSD